jgi:hypothetical protein
MTIETDKQFAAALVAIGKKNDKCLVGVEFDVDEMDEYQVRNHMSTFIVLCIISNAVPACAHIRQHP